MLVSKCCNEGRVFPKTQFLSRVLTVDAALVTASSQVAFLVLVWPVLCRLWVMVEVTGKV